MVVRVDGRQSLELINAARQVIIAGHRQPDGDCWGSMAGLCGLLVQKGKQVRMFMDEPLTDQYRFLPFADRAEKTPERPVQADLLVLLDIDLANRERLSYDPAKVTAPVLNIDHHPTNGATADYVWLEPERAATACLIDELIRLGQGRLTGELATCLYTGLACDTGFFRNRNTSAETFELAGRLAVAGADVWAVSENLQRVSQQFVRVMSEVLQTVEYHWRGRVALAAVRADQIDIETVDTSEIVSFLRIIDGVETAVLLKQSRTGSIRVSFRSGSRDVGKLAQKLGGGGHRYAAGCTFPAGDIAAARRMVLAGLAREYGDQEYDRIIEYNKTARDDQSGGFVEAEAIFAAPDQGWARGNA
ncbi:MAG: bifunctional oligoribonuclease/PAP phosphatase NrnA [Negativicutes bacterium]|nr:bifunctional oligoribonuclease/PAP phosphatase NrnA [Negativicutes bacterium]